MRLYDSLRKHGMMVQFVTVGTTVVSFRMTLTRLPPKKYIAEFSDLLLSHKYSELDTNPDMGLTIREFVEKDKNLENSETISEEGIMESITGKPGDDDKDSCDQSETSLSHTAALFQNALETVIRFFEF